MARTKAYFTPPPANQTRHAYGGTTRQQLPSNSAFTQAGFAADVSRRNSARIIRRDYVAVHGVPGALTVLRNLPRLSATPKITVRTTRNPVCWSLYDSSGKEIVEKPDSQVADDGT
jgi:hypothetical protein